MRCEKTEQIIVLSTQTRSPDLPRALGLFLCLVMASICFSAFVARRSWCYMGLVIVLCLPASFCLNYLVAAQAERRFVFDFGSGRFSWRMAVGRQDGGGSCLLSQVKNVRVKRAGQSVQLLFDADGYPLAIASPAPKTAAEAAGLDQLEAELRTLQLKLQSSLQRL